ncbi:MAG: heavy metal translocating P-type ATPase [Halobacteria archaeon]
MNKGDGETRDVRKMSYDVPEMDCPSCAGKIKKSVDRLEPLSYDANPTTGTVEIEFETGSCDEEKFETAIEKAGYRVTGRRDVTTDAANLAPEMDIWTSRRAIKTWISGLFLAVGMILKFGGFDLILFDVGVGFTASDLIFLVATAIGGQVILRNGYYSLRNLNLDIDILMTTAIIGAVIASTISGKSLYFEAATLAFMFSVAQLLEKDSMKKARNSLRELMELSPDTATIRRDGEVTTVDVDEVEVGDVVLVEPGEKIPMDGEIIEGDSAVNEAAITGESIPADKAPGDMVYAGTLNESGYLEVRAVKKAAENTVSKIIDLVEDAQSSKTQKEQFVDRFATYYTPVMVAVAIGVAVVPPLMGQSWTTWFVHGITMLVLACPCAFVISTPVTVVSGITSAARNGVLIKGGDRLEAMGEIEAVAFDKTGTLTLGELSVTDVIPVNGGSREDVLECARGVERRSEHPIGKAIVDHSRQVVEGEASVSDFDSITGMGVKAKLEGVEHWAGKPELLENLGFDLGHVHMVDGDKKVDFQNICSSAECVDLLEETIPRLRQDGKTVVLVANEDEVEGLIGVMDQRRKEAATTVEKLHSLGVRKLVMLTGDNEETARAIAEEIGIDGFRADLLPEQKVEAVQELEEEYGDIAMVGDGVNDAPALAEASVGIAMGAAGTDTAIETSDIALMSDDLTRVPYVYRVSRKASTIIKENIWSSLGVKLLLAVGVPLGYVNLALAVLIGDAGMTVAITGNAMRLSRLKPGFLE